MLRPQLFVPLLMALLISCSESKPEAVSDGTTGGRQEVAPELEALDVAETEAVAKTSNGPSSLQIKGFNWTDVGFGGLSQWARRRGLGMEALPFGDFVCRTSDGNVACRFVEAGNKKIHGKGSLLTGIIPGKIMHGVMRLNPVHLQMDRMSPEKGPEHFSGHVNDNGDPWRCSERFSSVRYD